MRLIDADVLKIDIVEEGQRSRRYKLGEIWELNRDEIYKVIDKQPTIEPERKKGRWIHDGYAFKGGIDWMHCSECGHKDSWSAATRTPFCAWCGKRMEGEG